MSGVEVAASPDGRRIAFSVSGCEPYASWSFVRVVDVAGHPTGDLRYLSKRRGFRNPAWSPDGTKLVFASTRDGTFLELYTMNADGSDVPTRLTNNDVNDTAPDWSPDGTKIAFTSDRSGVFAVFTMATNGSNVQKLTADSRCAGAPKYSPDGKEILFADGFCDAYDEQDLWTMKADGKNPKQVTNTAVNELPGGWSPDEKYVVAERFVFPEDEEAPPIFDLAKIKVSNGSVTLLTDTPEITEQQPFWAF